MDNNQKANLYNQYVELANVLQNENSRLKSMHPINMPEDIKIIIENNNQKLRELEINLNNLYK